MSFKEVFYSNELESINFDNSAQTLLQNEFQNRYVFIPKSYLISVSLPFLDLVQSNSNRNSQLKLMTQLRSLMSVHSRLVSKLFKPNGERSSKVKENSQDAIKGGICSSNII